MTELLKNMNNLSLLLILLFFEVSAGGSSSNDSRTICPVNTGTGLVRWQNPMDLSRRQNGFLHSFILASTEILWKTPGSKKHVVHSGEETCHFSLSKLMGEEATPVTLPTEFRVHTAWQKE